MTKFLKKAALFLGLLSAYYAIILGILFVSGDIKTIDEVIEYQDSHPNSLLGFGYYHPFNQLNFQAADRKKPELLILGTSRVGAFRSYLFKNPDAYYNAGSVRSIKNFKAFLEQLITRRSKQLSLV
jgi:hypothetical protein